MDLRAVLQPYVPRDVTGAVALVARGDDVEVAAVGHVDVERSASMTRETVFRIASATKPVTAAAAMVLVDDGVLALSSEVRTWLPELAAPSVVRTPESAVDDVVPVVRAITVEDLLTFRAGWGFPSDFGLPAVQPLFSELLQGRPEPQRVPPPDEWIARLARVPLLHQPGERWLYNTCSDVLGVLLERVSGQPLGELVAERLFGPLGMVDTGFCGPADRLPAYYRRDGQGAYELVDPPDGQWTTLPAFASGAGGLVSTVDDWHRFGRMLLADGAEVLSAEAVRLMTTNHLPEAQRVGTDLFLEGMGWGYGGSVDLIGREPWQVPGRYGWVGGTGTAAYVCRSTGTVSVLLTQQELAGPTAPEVMRAFWRYAA